MQQPAEKKQTVFSPPDLRVVRERPLFAFALYLMLGILSILVLPVSAAAGVLALLGLLLVCMVLFALKVDITVPLLLLAFVAGYALVCISLPSWAGDAWSPEGAVQVQGRITEVSTSQSGYTSYTLQNVTLNGVALQGGVDVTARSAAGQGEVGETLSTTTELARPDVSHYYGDYNDRGYLLRRAVRFVGFASAVHTTKNANAGSLWSLPGRARNYANTILNRYLEPQNAALISALLSGDKSGISADTKEDFIDLGVAHLLAVSGLNISLTAGAAWLLCRKLKLPRPVSLLVSFAVMASYVLFAGFTPSVERAAVMWLVMMGGIVAARRYDPLSSIAAAAIIILVLNPLDLFDAGFQLSFAATAAIFLWLAPLMRLAPENKFLKWFAGSIGVTACVTVLALPIILLHFKGVSLISPFANLVLVPAALVLQLAGTALLFLGFLPAAAGALGQILNVLTTAYLHTVTQLAWLTNTLHAAAPPLWLAALYALPVLAVSPSIMRIRPRTRAASAVALAVAAALMLSPLASSLIGRSDAAVVGEGSASLNICWQVNGRHYAACSSASDELAGYLQSRGISHLDGLYVLSAKPPKDGALLQALRVTADKLYVPGKWVGSDDAAGFLEAGAALGMDVQSAAGGPFQLLEGQLGAEALILPVSGGRLAYVPSEWEADTIMIQDALQQADVVVLGSKPAKSDRMLKGLSLKRLVLPGAIALEGCSVYNGVGAGSIEIESHGSALSLTPWIAGWADGLQGNFR